ncbi:MULTISPECIES: TonB-dependent receptor [unclassified Salinivibrio]|uniref:TonB-dependent receptor n=1 Tax=unclassified Salinivibrio TaxID=2636825 RepID=UPI00084C501B|nr:MULTISPECIES: TonB-dependent receptor [unclassified Salinivibrio]ODQ01451.1 TonB-dependent receptor [Salinivibrio sp. DV]PCE65347.1 TonB-dependent siderophore receptor [Salinivibrio sp. YCSC6]QCF37618.1 TonB-dependent receptor [Salinivibrio sp. YCSC6]
MKSKKVVGLSLTPLALVIGAHLAHAAPSAANTETIIVTGSKIQTTIADSASTNWVITNEELTREIQGGESLKGALGKLIPSFDFGSTNARTNASQNLRGRSAQIMIDGVALNAARTISRQLDSIDPFNVARVEVLSGATSIYGAGATGGIINIITKRGEAGDAQLEVHTGVTTGFNNSDDLTKKAAVAVSGGSDSLQGRLSVAYEGKGAAYDGNGEPILPDVTQTDTQFNDSIDVMGSLDYSPDDEQRLSLTAQYYDSQQDSDYGIWFEDTTDLKSDVERRKGLKLDEQPFTERLMLNTQYSHTNVLNHALLAQAYYREETFGYFPFPRKGLFSGSEQSNDVYGLKVLLEKNWDNLTLNYGLDYSKEEFRAKQYVYDSTTSATSHGLEFEKKGTIGRYPDFDTQNAGVFAQADWAVNDKLNAFAGLRYQYTKYKGSDFIGFTQQAYILLGLLPDADAIPGGTTDKDIWLANAGLKYDLTDNQQVWANFSQGFNMPDPGKFYGKGKYSGGTLTNSVSVQNTELDGVKTNSFELGWRTQQQDYNAQVAAYYSISDKSYKYNNDLDVTLDSDKQRIYGLEGQIKYYLTDTWYSRAQGHLVQSEIKDNGHWDELSIYNASPSTAMAAVGYDNFDWGTELNLQHVGDLSDEDGDRLEGYELVGLNGYYTLPVGQINFGIQNLFDKDYQTIWSQKAQKVYSGLASADMFDYAGVGRTFSLSYSATF